MLDQVVEQVIVKATEYCTDEKNRQALENKFILPITRYIAVRFSWIVWSFQLIVVLALIQTILLVWLLIRSFQRSALSVSSATVSSVVT
jgi:hypothetical protein